MAITQISEIIMVMAMGGCEEGEGDKDMDRDRDRDRVDRTS